MDNNQTTNKEHLFLEQILTHRESSPEHICFYFLNHLGDIEHEISVAQWIEKAKLAAAALKSKGVQPDDRVIIALPTSPEFPVIFLALWWIGAIPVPLINPMPGLRKEAFRDRFVHMVADCTPRGAIFMEQRKELTMEVRNTDLTPQSSKVSVWNCQELLNPDTAIDLKSVSKPVLHSKKTIAFLQYTSGSTGNPKGVIVTHGNLRANIQAISKASQAITSTSKGQKSDSCLSWMPFYHDMGLIGGLLFNTYYRIPLYLLSPVSFLTRPAVWIESIHRYRITLSTGNNFAYHLCARHIKPELIPGLDLSCWRLAYNGSESVNINTLRLFYEKFGPHGFKESTFYPVYGMAEATLAITFPKPGKKPRIDRVKRSTLIKDGLALPTEDDSTDTVKFVSNGHCIPDHELQIKESSSNRVLDERQIGEICLKGPSVTPGYFKPGNLIKAYGDELRTGDLGYLADGHLYIVDRLKDIIQIAGNTYYPSDIEKEVQRVKDVRPGRIISFDIPNSETGTNDLVIVAAVNRNIDSNKVTKEIRNQVYTAFGLAPQEIVLTDKNNIPITSSGKIQRQKCRNLYLNNEIPSD